MAKNIQDILRLVKLVNDFRQVRRTIPVVSEVRLENDVERSFQMAMLAWYLIDSRNLSYNKDHVIKYALIHDIVEVYSGDVDPFVNPDQHGKVKDEKEQDSLRKLQDEFSDFPEMLRLIEDYANKKDKESKFVYSLDKIISNLNNLSGHSNYYHKNNITFDKWISHNRPRASLSPEVKEYFEELCELLKGQDWLFPK